MARVQAAAGEESFGVFFDVIRHEVVYGSAESNHFRSNVVDKNSAVNASGVERIQEGLGRAAVFLNLREVRPLTSHQFQGRWFEHAHRGNVDVAVGDQWQSVNVRRWSLA